MASLRSWKRWSGLHGADLTSNDDVDNVVHGSVGRAAVALALHRMAMITLVTMKSMVMARWW